MNENNIRKYLYAFYDGTATDEEENKLKIFFEGEVPESWAMEKKCFKACLEATDIPLPEGLEERLISRLDQHSGRTKRQTLRWYLSRAAVVAAVFGTSLFLLNVKDKDHMMADTYADPVEAAQAAEEVLVFLSRQLNMGVAQLMEAKEEIDKANQYIYMNN